MHADDFGPIAAALARGDCDLAVHSAKDLPTQLAPGMTIAATPPRLDPRDCLVSREGATLTELPAGATVATSALRRQAILARLRASYVLAYQSPSETGDEPHRVRVEVDREGVTVRAPSIIYR